MNGSVSVTPATTTTYTITASNANGTATAKTMVTVNPVTSTVTLTGVSCPAAAISAGATVQCTAFVNPAPSSNLSAALTATGAVTVPASVVIAGTSNNFNITAGQVSSNQTATVTVTLGGISKTATVNLGAAASAGRLSGLVGLWNLNEGSGATAADSSGSGNTGTLVNSPVWTTGIATSGALQFNGSSYVSVPSKPSLSLNGTQMSFGAWYYHTAVADGFLMGKTVSDYTYILGVDKGAQQYVTYMKTGGKLQILRFPASVPSGLDKYLNSWVQLFVTYDGTTISTYINGVLSSTQAATGVVNSTTDGFAIGARGADGSWTRFNGRIDDVRVYNRALSASEVQLLYSQPGQN
jgi:hypothetical protein